MKKKRQPKLIAIIERLAKDIERRTSERPWNENRFACIAFQRLTESNLHKSFRENDCLAWLYKTNTLPEQLDRWMSFGQPPLTVWRGKRFLVDLYFWIQPEIAIHSHSFSGAFCNLQGDSFHCIYDFAARNGEAAASVFTGQLRLQQAEYLAPGAVRRIVAGQEFIHRIWHLDRPTITIVVRTVRNSPRVRLYRYIQPGIAVEARQTSDVFLKRRQFLRYLFERKHPQRDSFAERAIACSEPWESFGLLRDWIWLRYTFDQRSVSLSKSVMTKHQDWIAGAQKALTNMWREERINWSQIESSHDRFLLALLLSYSDQASIVRWMQKIIGEGWEKTAAEVAARIGRNGSLNFPLTQRQSENLARLARGGRYKNEAK